MKKIYYPLKSALMLTLLLFIAASARGYDFEDHYHELYFNVLDDGTASLTYYDDDYNSYSGYITVPDEAEMGALHPQYLSVTEIGEYAFRNCYNLTGVDIGSNVKTLGFDAFWNCTKLTNIDVPDNVTTIHNWCFENCSSLAEITLGSGLTVIGSYAFQNCAALRMITCKSATPPTIYDTTFPSDVTENASLYVPTPGAVVAYRASTYWNRFNEIYASRSYDFISNGIYYAITGSNTVKVANNGSGNTYSGSVTIPATVSYGGKTYRVTEIGYRAFGNCSGLTSVNIGSNVTIIGESAFSYSGLTSVVIPDNVTTIDYNAFGDISSLREVTIGRGVVYIDSYGFDSPLSKVTVLATTPPTLANRYVFKSDTYNNAPLIVPKDCYSAYHSATHWSNFSDIVEINYDFYVNGIYYKKTGTNTASVCRSLADKPSYDYTGTVTIPATVAYNGTTYRVTGIDDLAFYECSVTKVNIGSNVTKIGSSAFCDSRLTSMTIPNTVTTIESSAFESCSALKTISLGSGITKICDNTFAHSGLTSITIPSNVKTIEHFAFYYCTSLSTLNIGSGVTTIGDGAFYFCENLTTVTIPDNVKTIEGNAFYYCTSLKTLKIGSGVTSIGNLAFYECTALTSVTCNALTPPTIQSNTFYPSSIYSSATLTVPGPKAVTTYRAANYWKNFTNITPAHPYDFALSGIYYLITGTNTLSVTYKDTNYNSYTSTQVSVPATLTYSGTTYKVTAIGDNAFRKCTSMTKVNIGSNVTTIGQYAFYNSGLTTITIPDNVTTIKSNAFASCSNLAIVTIGKGVTSIAAQAFDSPVTSVTCSATTPPTMSNTNAFRTSTYDYATLYVPAASLSAYRTASGWRYFAKIQPIGGSMPGDLNGDGSLDVSDVTALISMALGNTTPNPAVGDLNGDGVIDVSDVTALIKRVLGN